MIILVSNSTMQDMSDPYWFTWHHDNDKFSSTSLLRKKKCDSISLRYMKSIEP